jgi:hypothetical protein
MVCCVMLSCFAYSILTPVLVNDAIILFDSFTHIYLVFCICFIYKISWYSLFYVLKALLDIRFKKK